VLDVADHATVVLIGAILSGQGSLYIADVHVDVVGPEVSVTEQRHHASGLLQRPTNLSFEESV